MVRSRIKNTTKISSWAHLRLSRSTHVTVTMCALSASLEGKERDKEDHVEDVDYDC